MAYMKDATGRRLDGFAIRPGWAPNRAVLLGDSFWEQNGGPRKNAGLVTFDAKGPVIWANFLLGQAFRIVKNVGVGGQRMQDFAARVPADVDAYSPNWVIGTGGVNDIGQGRTTAQIIADFTALFNLLITARGYRVSWNTITYVTDWTNAQNRVQTEVNHWLRTEAPSLWPNLVVCDVAAAVDDPSLGYVSDWRSDSTHPAAGGAFRIGRAMAAALRPFAPTAPPILESRNGSNSMNLITNARFNNPASGVGAGWSGGGTNAVHSQVARTDGVPGVWQRMTITSEGAATLTLGNVAIDTAKVTPGVDVVRLAVEVNVAGLLAAPTALTQRFNARVQFYDASNALLKQMDGAYADGSYKALYVTDPGRGILATPEFLIPATATKWTVSLSAVGTGVFDWDRPTLAKVVTPAY